MFNGFCADHFSVLVGIVCLPASSFACCLCVQLEFLRRVRLAEHMALIFMIIYKVGRLHVSTHLTSHISVIRGSYSNILSAVPIDLVPVVAHVRGTYSCKSKVVPLHAMEAHGGEEL
jgi:hypothetical protein